MISEAPGLLIALSKYEFTHNGKYTRDVSEAMENGALGDLPVAVMTCSSDIYIEELKSFGSLDDITARKIELLWQDLMKRYLTVSKNTKYIPAPHSGHYIHLTDFEALKEALAELDAGSN